MLNVLIFFSCGSVERVDLFANPCSGLCQEVCLFVGQIPGLCHCPMLVLASQWMEGPRLLELIFRSETLNLLL